MRQQSRRQPDESSEDGVHGRMPEVDCASLIEEPIFLGSVGAGLLIAAVLALFSLGGVPPLHHGIRYNSFSKYVDTEHVYTPGRYFIGPWNSFVLFPASVRSVEFSSEPRLGSHGVRYPPLHTRTKEGLALHMQVALQYQLIPSQVGKLYVEFNQNYEQFFVSTIRDTLIKVAAEYEGYQLWKMRKEVSETMHDMVTEALNQTFATCWGLQILVIELPDSFENSIVATQVQKQNFSTMEYSQQATQIRAETNVIAAEYQREVKVITAYGRANYTLVTKTAKASARQKTLRTETEVLDSIKAKLRLLPEDLVQYQELAAIQLMRNASMLYGFQDSGLQVLMPMREPPAAKSGRRLDEL